MELKVLKERTFSSDSKISAKYRKLVELIDELRSRELNIDLVEIINKDIDIINSIEEREEFSKVLRTKLRCILNNLVKKEKIVPQGYYRNQWVAIGMSIFGIPLGMLFSQSLDSFAYLSLGLPMGMAIGIALGADLDNKAKKKGLQLKTSLS